MAAVVSAPNGEVTASASYVSRWIAQSHGAYQNKTNEFYSPTSPASTSSSSSCEFRTPLPSGKTTSFATLPTTTTTTWSSKLTKLTTWQAQARLRSDAVAAASLAATHDSLYLSPISNNNELQEKLRRVRALLDAKKRRACRYTSSSSSIQKDQVLSSTAVGEQTSPTLLSSALENFYIPHDESRLSTNYNYQNSSILPCLIEESPSDSGCSDGTKTVNNDDMIETTVKNSALIDLSKPLCKEEMLAIIQVLRELWKKQFGSDIPDTPMKTTPSKTNTFINQPIGNTFGTSYLSNNKKEQYHSTPVLNKLSAELSDIKDKLKKFSSNRTDDEQPKQISTETKANENVAEFDYTQIYSNRLLFIPLGPPLTGRDLERMQAKKDALIRRQIKRREEQLIRKNERMTAAIQCQNENRLYEEYMTQRRLETDHRRRTILQAHVDQKRLEADPPSVNDYYFAAARNRNRLKRKASMTSFVSFDDDVSYGGSTFDLFSTASGKRGPPMTRRSNSRYDFISPSLTASTTASRSKMNRAASICNINEQYDSFTSLNSKTTMPVKRTTRPATLFGGSLMNISMNNATNNKQSNARAFNLLDDGFDLTAESPLSGSLSSLAFSTPTGSRLARSQTHLSTKSNKKTIINAFRQIVLAGPANDRQRDTVIREIELCEARHFIILFRDHRLQFRSVYMYIPETDIIEKLCGVGPNIITEVMVEKWFKYNSGSKQFKTIPIRHFSIQCDAVIIHNDFWQKKLLMHMNKLH